MNIQKFTFTNQFFNLFQLVVIPEYEKENLKKEFLSVKTKTNSNTNSFINEPNFSNHHSSPTPKKPFVIRAIKNKKIVYCQADKSPSSTQDLSVLNSGCIDTSDISSEINLQEDEELSSPKQGKRGSKYRGVSKNGNQWQVLIMVNKKKRYIGNYKTEDEAASSYDIVAIQNHGSKAKTNFYYTPEQIKKIKQDKKITWRT